MNQWKEQMDALGYDVTSDGDFSDRRRNAAQGGEFNLICQPGTKPEWRHPTKWVTAGRSVRSIWERGIPTFGDPVSAAIFLAIEQSNN